MKYRLSDLRAVRGRLGFLPALLVVVLIGCSSSNETEDQGKYPLWKIQGERNTVYLLGSVHMLPESAHPFPKAFDDAYTQAEHVVFEVDMGQDALTSGMMGMLMKAMIMDGRTIKDLISEETWQLLEPRLDDIAESLMAMSGEVGGGMGLPMAGNADVLKEGLMRMKPWFLGMLLQVGEAQGDGGYRPDLGVDMHYTVRANEDGKDISGLETMQEQIGFFEELTGEAGEEFLRSSLEATSPGAEDLDEIVTAWKNGDIKTLDRLVNGSMAESPEVYNLLIVERNKNWVPQIEKFLKDSENYLVVVGAGHLVGDKSVVKMLRDKGYKVDRQ